MINSDIIIITLSIAISLYFIIYNIVKKYYYLENVLFILASLSWSAMLFIDLYGAIYPGNTHIKNLDKYYFCFFIIVCQSIFSIMHIFPRWEKRPRSIFVILPQVPAIVLLGLALFSDQIISDKPSFYENPAYLYAAVSGIYIVAACITFFFKSRHFENESFKIQLLLFLTGMCSALIVLFTFYMIFPFYFNIYNLKNFGLLGAFFLQLVLNYSLADKRQKDFKKLYIKSALWILMISAIFISVCILIEKAINLNYTIKDPMLYFGSIIIPLISIVLYHILKYLQDGIINKKTKELSEVFKKILLNISELFQMKKQKIDWDIFFEKTIDTPFGMLKIDKVSFFLLNDDSNVYELKHAYNENLQTAELPAESDIVTALVQYKHIIEKSFLFHHKELKSFKNVLIGFFNSKNINVALPVFNHMDKLTGILFLGKLAGEKSFPVDLISFLDTYRIQFSLLLENLRFSEEIRRAQVSKRDRLIVKNIKKRILPNNFKNIKGLKVSSLYINNSDTGGDFFDSVKIQENKLGIFIADTSYAGIESVLLALQMNSVFNSQADIHETPESLLNIVNKVVCTSRFSEKYASAFYMIYDASSREILFSNAAFNPLIIFDTKKESFVEFDSEGIPIGIDVGFQYKHRTLLAPSNTLGLFYSPGVLSAINKAGDTYPVSKIKNIISSNKDDPPTVLVRKVYEDFYKFLNFTMPNDVMLVIFKTD